MGDLIDREGFEMVGVAQVVERQVVALVVVGSSPITHPIIKFWKQILPKFFNFCARSSAG